MSQLTPLSKEEVKRLEQDSVRIESAFPRVQGNLLAWNRRYRKEWLKSMELMCTLQGWYHTHGLPAGGQMRKHWAKMAELLGHKPTYYVSHECYNAVWGFSYEGDSFILYKDERGIALQVSKTFHSNKIIPLLELLIKLLVKEGSTNG